MQGWHDRTDWRLRAYAGQAVKRRQYNVHWTEFQSDGSKYEYYAGDENPGSGIQLRIEHDRGVWLYDDSTGSRGCNL